MSFDLIISILKEIVTVGVFFFKWTWPAFVVILLWETYQNYRKKEWVENLEHVIVQIEIPKENDKGPISAEMMFASLHGILKKAEEQQKEGSLQEHFSFEIVATLNAIKFYVWTPIYLKDFLESQIYAQYPSAEVSLVDDYTQDIDIDDDGKDDCIASTELVLEKSDLLPIKTFKNFEVDPLASITSTLSKLDDGHEQVWIQFLVKPADSSWQGEAKEYTNNLRTGTSPMTLASVVKDLKKLPLELPKQMLSLALKAPEPPKGGTPAAPKLTKQQDAELAAIDEKSNKLGYHVKIRVMYLAKTREKAKHRLQAIVGSYKQFTTTINGFTSTATREGKEPLDEYRARYFDNGFLLNIEEMASVFHLPHASVETPNINWVSSKKAEPPTNLPIEGSSHPLDITLFAQTNFRGARHKFGIKTDDRRRHMYIIGKSGVGKSWLLALLSISDMYAGKGICVIDPHGDLAEKVLSYVPRHRMKDVIYFNPSDVDYPLAFNTLECPDPSFKETIASGFVSIFKKQFGHSWGPRLEYVLRYSILALLDYPNATMLGVIRMLTEKNFRQKVLKCVQDPVVKNFWEKEFATYNDRFATEAVAPILNKVGQFIASPLIRNIVGQPKSTLDIRKIMDEQKILIINLSSGRIGEDNTALLGSMLITKVQLAAMSRADMPEDERKDFYLYVDEFQNFATDSFAKILSEARKYRLNLIVANQYISQMQETVRDAVFGNVGSLLSYRVGAGDAKALQNEFSGVFDSNDLINLPNQQIYLKMLIDGVTRQPFSAKILNLPPTKEDLSREIMEFVRKEYGRPKHEVEEMIAALSTDPHALDEENEEKPDRPERPPFRPRPPRQEERYNPRSEEATFEQYTAPKREVNANPERPAVVKKERSDRLEHQSEDRYITKHTYDAPVKQFVKHNYEAERHNRNRQDYQSRANQNENPRNHQARTEKPRFEKPSKPHYEPNHNKTKSQEKINENDIRQAIREAMAKKENVKAETPKRINEHHNHNGQPPRSVSPEVAVKHLAEKTQEIKPGETVVFEEKQ